MQTLELLQKKRDGEPLSEKEFSFLIEGYVRGEIPDYQMAALLTSIYLNSLTEPEIFSLTKSMAESGEEVDFSCISGFKADKHSTGGVGDKVSLLLVPLVASCDLVIGKLSGRGLGHTGGTIDKLESIPGFKATISKDRFIKSLRKSGLGIIEHTEQLVPADRKLYTLRNETATVDSIPLIISSIMSKKMACHPDGLVLDIKVGSGAFLKTRQEAQELGYGCVKIGKKANLNTSALLTNMNQPLGRTIGNAIEVEEAILTARGEKKGELHHLAIELASELLVKAKSDYRLEDARQILKRKIKDGEVAEKWRAMIEN
ncbi:MAG: thymidine phosphorylase, partial [Candidatus Bipolaricaulota bacterium]